MPIAFVAITMASIGPSDGSGSKFVADANGAATLEVMVPSGAVTVPAPNKSQTVPGCLLDAYEVHLVAAYHINGQTYGSVPGDADKIAEQVGWMFQQGAP